MGVKMLYRHVMVLGIFGLAGTSLAMEQVSEGKYSENLDRMIAQYDFDQEKALLQYKSELTVIPECDIRTQRLLRSRRPGLYVPGLGEESAVFEMKKYRKNYAAKANPSLLYPDNLIVYNAPDQGASRFSPFVANKGTSFGQKEGRALIYQLDEIVNKNGIRDLTLFPICRGATSFVYALDILLRNSERDNKSVVEKFGMNSTDCKDILHAVKSVVLQCPMQSINDSVDLITEKYLSQGMDIIKNVLPGCSFAKIDHHVPYPSLQSSLAFLASKATLNCVLPVLTSYSPSQKKPIDMLLDLEGLKHECPAMHMLMTAKGNDQFIGSDPSKIERYYHNFPVKDSQKYLIASAQTSPKMDINHVTLSPEVKLAWHAFLARSGSSYYQMPVELEKGDVILDDARAQQATLGVQAYLADAFYC